MSFFTYIVRYTLLVQLYGFVQIYIHLIEVQQYVQS